MKDTFVQMIFLLSLGVLLLTCSQPSEQKLEVNKSHVDFQNDPKFPAFNKELILSIKGDSISGYAFIANDSTRKETVILVQGYPGNDNNFDLAQAIRRNNMNVIIFHHRGAWGSQGQYTYSNCLEDIDELIKLLQAPDLSNELRIDTDKIALVGRSYGGGISLIQGSKIASVKKIVAISSVNYGWLMENYEKLEDLGGFKKYMKKQVMINTDIDDFLQELLDKKQAFNVLSYREQLSDKKVMILEDSDKNNDWTLQLEEAKIVKVKSGHNFIDRRIEMIDLIVHWLNES